MPPMNLRDAGPNHCRFIAASPVDMLICGDDVVPSRSYCSFHLSLCLAHPYGRPPQNKIPPPDTEGESGAAQAAPADCPQSPPETLQRLDQAIPRSPPLEAGALGTAEAGDADR